MVRLAALAGVTDRRGSDGKDEAAAPSVRIARRSRVCMGVGAGVRACVSACAGVRACVSACAGLRRAGRVPESGRVCVWLSARPPFPPLRVRLSRPCASAFPGTSRPQRVYTV